jgi:alpha-amylase/alpha-mannosidase (GH57 family)
MSRYLCIHGHFYQPPRENPWLEAIELQDSAYPYHDWNERITAECYGPNAVSRILDGERRIERIVNNYTQISFNFGPTLLAWMEEKRPDVYRAIVEADELSRVRFDGHGSALAQPYHHAILPLANSRDKRTQILWGLADFERRFKRKAEGVWLPEAAVDLESLDILAGEGIQFTILEPGQAGGPVDTTVPYKVSLPSGRTIAVFFYDGATSRAVAFEGLLSSGERFAQRLVSRFPEDDGSDRLVHIATDGETYGHHHAYGEMALSYALHHIESNGWAKLTNYGAYLAAHPPEQEIEIRENTSWSCAHGVERWRSDCGCHTGGGPGWNQAWRAPLREALDWLRDELAPLYEAEADWETRDRYLLERPTDVRALELLEMQRHAMLMYTSCGWFFNDLAGIETVQVLQYAGRVVQLAERLFGAGIEDGFLSRLERARSNGGETGRDLYEKHVRPAMVDLPEVAVHYAVTSLFQDYPSAAKVYCYSIERRNGRVFNAGRARLAIGKALVTSDLTGDSDLLSYGVLHFGDHNLSAGVRKGEEGYANLITELGKPFEQGDFAQAIRLLDRHFDGLSYSLRSLFRDEQRRVLDLILASTLDDAEDELREMYVQNAPLLRFLAGLGTPLPNALRSAAELVLNLDLKRSLAGPADPEEVERLLAEASALDVDLDEDGLSYTLERNLEDLVGRLGETPMDTALLDRVDAVADLARKPLFRINLWRAQNRCHEMLASAYPLLKDEAEAGEEPAAEWVERFRALAGKLGFRVD